MAESFSANLTVVKDKHQNAPQLETNYYPLVPNIMKFCAADSRRLDRDSFMQHAFTSLSRSIESCYVLP